MAYKVFIAVQHCLENPPFVGAPAVVAYTHIAFLDAVETDAPLTDLVLEFEFDPLTARKPRVDSYRTPNGVVAKLGAPGARALRLKVYSIVTTPNDGNNGDGRPTVDARVTALAGGSFNSDITRTWNDAFNAALAA